MYASSPRHPAPPRDPNLYSGHPVLPRQPYFTYYLFLFSFISLSPVSRRLRSSAAARTLIWNRRLVRTNNEIPKYPPAKKKRNTPTHPGRKIKKTKKPKTGGEKIHKIFLGRREAARPGVTQGAGSGAYGELRGTAGISWRTSRGAGDGGGGGEAVCRGRGAGRKYTLAHDT